MALNKDSRQYTLKWLCQISLAFDVEANRYITKVHRLGRHMHVLRMTEYELRREGYH